MTDVHNDTTAGDEDEDLTILDEGDEDDFLEDDSDDDPQAELGFPPSTD